MAFSLLFSLIAIYFLQNLMDRHSNGVGGVASVLAFYGNHRYYLVGISY